MTKIAERLNEQAGQRLAISVDEAAELLGISRGLAFEMARDGRLPARRLGRRFIVPLKALERWLAEADEGWRIR